MNKKDKIFYGSWAIVGVIVFLLLTNSYVNAPDEYIAAPMAIKEIPLNAVKFDDARASFVPYNGIIYGKNVSFLPVNVNDENFFKITQFDQIKFSIKNKRSGTAVYQDTATISVRGIKHSELPIVYDYSKEISLWPAELSRASWYNSEGVSFTITETAPWLVNVKISKETGFAFIASVVLSIIVGYLVLSVLSVLSVILFILLRSQRRP